MKTIFAALLLSFLPVAANAHHVLGGAEGRGFAAGFAHPFFGPDHLLAMVCVGIWAAQSGGRQRFLVPAAFVLSMVAGLALGAAGVPLPHVELGIAASVMLLGACIALAYKPSVLVGAAIAGVCALFHGYAHGLEMPSAASPVLYGLGMVLATALLHAAGVLLCTKAPVPSFRKATGFAVIPAGGFFVFSAL